MGNVSHMLTPLILELGETETDEHRPSCCHNNTVSSSTECRVFTVDFFAQGVLKKSVLSTELNLF